MAAKKSKLSRIRQKWNNYSATQQFFIFVGMVLGVIILFLAVEITWSVIDYRLSSNAQKAKYSAALARCGTKPTVIVESHALEETDTRMYTPRHPDYENQKEIVTNPISLMENHVTGYYCTAVQARAAVLKKSIPPVVIDGSANYSSEQERIDTYLLADQSIGAKFYEPTITLPDIPLATRTLDSSNQAAFNYLPKGSSRPDKNGFYDITLVCILGGNENNATLHDSSLRVPAGTNFYGRTIYYAGPSTGETAGQLWDTELPGAECELSDNLNRLTKDQGMSLISSLRQADYTAYRGFGFTF